MEELPLCAKRGRLNFRSLDARTLARRARDDGLKEEKKNPLCVFKQRGSRLFETVNGLSLLSDGNDIIKS